MVVNLPLLPISFSNNSYQQPVSSNTVDELLDYAELSKSYPIYQEKFARTLLVIHFNHPFYANINFIKSLYAPFFPHIVFYGERPHPEVITIKTQTGFLHSPVIRDVFTRYPDFDGYLFLEDDCILNVWNCLAFDLNKVWLPANNKLGSPIKSEPGFLMANMATGANSKMWWWPSHLGFAPTKIAYSKLLPRDLEIINANLGKDNAAGAVCDMFYIPGKYSADVIRLSELFFNVFVEIAIPTILCCLDHVSNWQGASMAWGSSPSPKNPWPVAYTCIHPVKLSNQKNRAQIMNAFNNMLKN